MVFKRTFKYLKPRFLSKHWNTLIDLVCTDDLLEFSQQNHPLALINRHGAEGEDLRVDLITLAL
jgi:hypothetical protein